MSAERSSNGHPLESWRGSWDPTVPALMRHTGRAGLRPPRRRHRGELPVRAVLSGQAVDHPSVGRARREFGSATRGEDRNASAASTRVTPPLPIAVTVVVHVPCLGMPPPQGEGAVPDNGRQSLGGCKRKPPLGPSHARLTYQITVHYHAHDRWIATATCWRRAGITRGLRAGSRCGRASGDPAETTQSAANDRSRNQGGARAVTPLTRHGLGFSSSLRKAAFEAG